VTDHTELQPPAPVPRHRSRRRWALPQDERGRLLVAALALIACGMLWSSNTVLVRGLRADVPPIAFAAARWAIAAIVLLPFAWRPLLRDMPLVRAHWRGLMAAGVVGIALFTVVLFVGVQNTVALNSGLLSATQSLWVGLVAWAVLGDRLNRWQWVGFLVAACGVAVIVTQGHVTELERVDFRIGDPIYVASLVIWGFYSVILQKLPRSFDIRTILLVTAVIGAMALMPFWLGEAWLLRGTAWSWEVVAALLYGAVFSGIGAFGLWNLGVVLIGASAASFFMYLIPIYTGFFAVLLLDETLHLFHLAGAVLILAGVIAASRGARARKPSAD
jgi:drug/metabolite transporter (DMT)-like permease